MTHSNEHLIPSEKIDFGCGRFVLATTPAAIEKAFTVVPSFDLTPRYNIASTQNTLVIRNNDEMREAVMLRWGFVPSWMKEQDIKSKYINARVETAHSTPMFRTAFRKQRCIIVASGFYEWQQSEEKIPYYIHSKNNELLAMAGLWAHWQQDDKIIESCTILTKNANKSLLRIHDRNPVFLQHNQFDGWLDTSMQDVDALHALLKVSNKEPLIYHRVAKIVNNPRHDQPDCIAPIEDTAL